MNNFQAFLNDYKSSNPKNPFERSLVKFSNDLKSIISGFKEMIVSSGKKSTPESATSVIKEFENQREQEFEIERVDFSEIKDILNAIQVNTSLGPDGQKLISYENRDNFTSPQENEAKDSKFEIDMEKKQFLMQKEQLEVVKEIRDILKPRVPSEIEEQKAKPIDLFAFLNEENKQQTSSPIGDAMRRKGDNATVITDSNGKKAPVKPKQSKLGKIMGGIGKVGLGATAALGAGYFLNDVYNQVKKEEHDNKIKEIDAELMNGNISQLQADSMKGEIDVEYKKDLTKEVSEDVGNLSGTIAGGFLGAKIGSVAGPVGSIGGGILGSIIGGVSGTEAGKHVGAFLNENDVGEIIDSTKKQALETLETAKEKYEKAKEFVQTDLIPEASKKIETFITTIKEGINVDSIREKTASGLGKLKEIIEPETSSQAAKMIGSQPGKFVQDTIKEVEKLTEKTAGGDDSKVLVNNIVNNQSTNNYIPMKATPRAEHTGSALDRYTDRLSMF